MIKLFRVALLVSMVAIVAMLGIPFDRPFEISFPVEHPPATLMLMALCALLTFALVPIAVYGLARFRRWGRGVAAVAALPLLGLVLIMALPTQIGSAVSMAAKAAGLVAIASWLLTIVLSHASDVRQRFLSPQ